MKFICFLVTIFLSRGYKAQEKFCPPLTEKKNVVEKIHRIKLIDNYRWLENKNDQKVIEWTKAQTEYGEKYLQSTQKIIKGLKEEIVSLCDKDIVNNIEKKGNRIFQLIHVKGEKYSKLYTILDEKKKLLWDPLLIDTTGHSSISEIAYSYDGEIAAISMETDGTEISRVYIIETRSGNILYPPLNNIESFKWAKDQKHAYITICSQEDINEQLALKTFLWTIGSPLNKAIYLGKAKTKGNSYFTYDNRYSDVSFYGEGNGNSISLNIRETGSLKRGKLIYKSSKYMAMPEAIDDKIYVMTNDNAPNFKIMVATTKEPEFKNWRELIHESNSVIQEFVVTKCNIILIDKIDVQRHLTLYKLNGERIKQILLPEEGNLTELDYNREEDSVRINIETFTSIGTTYIASPRDFKWRVYFKAKDLDDNMNDIIGEIKYCDSNDGLKIPVYIVHKKEILFDGNNPTLITAYGGFNEGIEQHYFGYYAPFLNRGGVVVEAGIRGGDEYGEKWHQDGMLANKQNCFNDFNSCAEWLISEKYTSASKLVAVGESNGGLLMGAIATQRPDLYKAIVCESALLDMVHYHKYLVAPYWISEYGTSEKKTNFDYLLKYSPYHNIHENINLPSMLIIASEDDNRVDPLHSKKFTAKAQNNKGQINPIILHVLLNTGHDNEQTTKDFIDKTLLFFNFIMNQTDMQ